MSGIDSKKRSQIWFHFDNLNNNRAECRHCKIKLWFQGTNNLHRHLRAVHPDVPLAVKRRLSESTPAPDLAPIDGDPDPTATTTLSAPCAPGTRK